MHLENVCERLHTSNVNLPTDSPPIAISMKTNRCCDQTKALFIRDPFYAAVINVLSTCPGFFEVFDVEILSGGLVERLRPNKSEAELILGPFDQILLIAKKKVVQKTHQAAAILPNFTTQLLESQVIRENSWLPA